MNVNQKAKAEGQGAEIEQSVNVGKLWICFPEDGAKDDPAEGGPGRQ